jgi:hypothetical protein
MTNGVECCNDKAIAISPDGRENPFVPEFGTKDWNDSWKSS